MRSSRLHSSAFWLVCHNVWSRSNRTANAEPRDEMHAEIDSTIAKSQSVTGVPGIPHRQYSAEATRTRHGPSRAVLMRSRHPELAGEYVIFSFKDFLWRHYLQIVSLTR